MSPSRLFAYNHSVCWVNCINDCNNLLPHVQLYPESIDKQQRTGTWDPWCAIRSDRHKLVSEPGDGSERGRESGSAASRKKTEHHRCVRVTHSDHYEEDCSTGGSPCATIEDGRPKRVAIESVLVRSWMIRKWLKECGVQSLEKANLFEDCERWRL